MTNRGFIVFFLLVTEQQTLMSQRAEPLASSASVALTVAAGVPLRVTLDRRVHLRTGAPLSAKLLDPIYAFDRVVIPSGTTVVGRVAEIAPVPARERLRSVVGGDFTPLRRARLDFTSVLLPDGKQIPIQTTVFPGSSDLVERQPSKKRRARAVIGAEGKRIEEILRRPGKTERLVDALVLKVPYHPQWYRRGTRLDAVLTTPLQFGDVNVGIGSWQGLASRLPADGTVKVRLLTALSSRTSKRGDPIKAVTSEPLFSADRRLILPEGIHVTGVVQQAKPGRSFHRCGQLRFRFDSIDVPPLSRNEHIIARAELRVAPLQFDPRSRTQIDQEGAARATESKARLLAPVIAGIAAANSMDNDSGQGSLVATDSASPGVGGIAGFSGLGLPGTIAGVNSRIAAAAIGYYGFAWSIYSNIVSRGREVEFQRNTTLKLQLGSRH